MTGLTTAPHSYYQPTGTGDSYVVPDAKNIVIFDPPGGPFASFTVTMPMNPVADQEVGFTSTATIVEVILHARPGHQFGRNTSMTSISANGAGQRFVWRGGASTWYQVP
jgi:hypothetical protein